MQLKQLLQAVPTLKIEGTVDREVTGITYDSRRVTPGVVFVAVPGQNVDGHEFINSAIDRGASAIICERNGFSSPRATKIKVADAREAMAHAAAVFYGRPADRLKLIGITGTNGKTTVAFMVRQMLEISGVHTGLISTVRYEIGARLIPAHRTTPEALDIHQLFDQMVRAQCQACVMEVSSHALEQKRVAGIAYDVALFTNLTQDHLDYHGTMENYYLAKEKLFRAAPGGKKQSAVINIDDGCGARLSKATDFAIQMTYGLSESAQLRATKVELGKDGTRFTVEAPEHSFDIRMPLIGRHNIYNALAAIGAGLVLKLEVAAIRTALSQMPPVPGRLESVPCGQPFGVYVDYAHTDDALSNVLKTVRELTPNGRVLLLFGCGGSRDKGKRSKMGRVAAELADFSLITSDNPRKESAAEIAAQIDAGFREVRSDGYQLELDRRRAIVEILRQARPGDSVLLAGKGHETYQEFEDSVVPFDDRVYARETLESLGWKRGQNSKGRH
ncbi:MAG: UDP-N-acetylmuramoyl-L-alanyl-D-glutamate--2,6-diaminopimelate ligase [Verrucomicrobiota bacterium]